ncbi:MAG: preprotein translocase subunit YajC [Bifidobacteriaceae bacterium]|nr:preprotein translocase subunit YajC [Bifidobacteriaceae bacterium]
MITYLAGLLAEGETETPLPTPGGGSSNFIWVIFLVGMIGLMFFMSRRNKKQQQQQADFRDSLGPGQRVMTAGGMIGVVTGIQGDVVTLMSPSGDESAYVRRAIRSQLSDEEWGAMLEPLAAEDEDLAAEDEDLGGAGDDAPAEDAGEDAAEEAASEPGVNEPASQADPSEDEAE